MTEDTMALFEVIKRPTEVTCWISSDHSILEGVLPVEIVQGNAAICRWRHVTQT